MPAEAGIAAQRAGLQSLIDEEESRLEAPGFTGDNLLAEPHRPLTPETMRLLSGLLAELYANIAKHAIRANGTPSASPSTRTPSTSPPATPSHPMTRDSASTATKPSSKHTSAPSKPTPNKPTGSWRPSFPLPACYRQWNGDVRVPVVGIIGDVERPGHGFDNGSVSLEAAAESEPYRFVL